jgi:hypothetical protein
VLGHRLRLEWLVAALILVPAALLAAGIQRWSVNIPAWDDWELVPLLTKHHDGQLRFADFWVQHNEHRLVVPKAVMLVLAQSSKWDLRYELVASFATAALICLFLLWAVRRTFAERSMPAFIIVGVAAGWIVFSASQWENWLWGWQLQWFINVLGVVLTGWALAGRGALPHPGRRVVIAMGGALLGTFSLASGMLIWVAALPTFLVRRELRRYVIVWCGAGAITAALYFNGYVKPRGHPPLSAFFDQPWQSVRYVLTYIGLPAGPTAGWALIAGAALLLAIAGGVVYGARRRDDVISTAAVPWVSMALYGLLTSGVTALGRIGFVGVPPAPRYTTIAMLVLLAALVVVALVLVELPRKRPGATIVRVAAGPLAGLLALGFCLNYLHGLNHMEERHATLLRLRACMLGATSASDPCLRDVYPDSSTLWARLEWLRAFGWGGFPRPVTTMPEGIGPSPEAPAPTAGESRGASGRPPARRGSSPTHASGSRPA